MATSKSQEHDLAVVEASAGDGLHVCAAEQSAAVAGSALPEACPMVSASGDRPDACATATEQSSCVAVLGAGVLGKRIVAEFLLLGWRVAVYDHALARQSLEDAQSKLNGEIWAVLQECASSGLLELAGMQSPPSVSGASDWRPYEDASPRSAQVFLTIGEAARNADLVVEAVPDTLGVKGAVLAEAAAVASTEVILATSTLTLPLSAVRAAISGQLDPSKSDMPRVVGLRFLFPVVFVPFVEVTLTAEQQHGEDGEALMRFLRQCGKTAFVCDVEGAVQTPEDCLFAAHPFRLDAATAQRRQAAEARLRHARFLGSAAVAALKPADVFDFQEEGFCCVCLDSSASVTSLLCGHKVLCEACAKGVLSGTRRCPICRVHFEVAVDGTTVRG